MTTLSFRAVVALTVISALASIATAADVGVRIRFGLMDKEPATWDGTVNVKPGKVVQISGWRFEQTDRANGTEGWSAATRPIAAALRTNAQKAKAKAANPQANGKGKKAGAAAKAKAKANQNLNDAGVPLADNGVLLSLADVTEDSVVSVKTAQGEFNVKLSEIPYGRYVERLDGGVEIERVAAWRQISNEGKTDDDYPSAAVG